MAKKKKTKSDEETKVGISAELTGLILILIGIIGFGFGPVGSFIKKFAMFLVGGWAWIFLLMFLLVLGFYMLVKRSLPKFFSQRLVGLYVLIIVVLVASHFGFIRECENTSDIFETTINQYMERISTIGSNTALFTSGDATIEIGGGVIGAIFSVALSSLFGLTGTKIVCVILVIFGLILFFNLTFSDIYNKIKGFIKNLKNREIKEKPIKDDTYAYEEDQEFEEKKNDKIIITSMDELKTIKEPQKENLETNKESIYEVSSNYTLPPLSLLDDATLPKKNVASNNYVRSNKDNL